MEKEKNSTKTAALRIVKRVAFLVLAAILTFKGFNEASFAKWEYEYYDELMEDANDAIENLYVYETDDTFDSTEAFIDESGLIDSGDRREVVNYEEEIFDATGVLFYIYVISEEEGSDISTAELDDLARSFYDEKATESANGGENIYVLFINPAVGNANYSMVRGNEAKKVVKSFDADFEQRFTSMIKYFNGEGYYTQSTDSAIWELTYEFETLDKIIEDPADYYIGNAEYYHEYAQEETRTAVIYGVFALIALIIAFGDKIKGLLKKEKDSEESDSSNVLWEKELHMYGESKDFDGFDDVDDEANPYHDLVEKYGGFENDVKSDEEEKTTDAGDDITTTV